MFRPLFFEGSLGGGGGEKGGGDFVSGTCFNRVTNKCRKLKHAPPVLLPRDEQKVTFLSLSLSGTLSFRI